MKTNVRGPQNVPPESIHHLQSTLLPPYISDIRRVVIVSFLGVRVFLLLLLMLSLGRENEKKIGWLTLVFFADIATLSVF